MFFLLFTKIALASVFVPTPVFTLKDKKDSVVVKSFESESKPLENSEFSSKKHRKTANKTQYLSENTDENSSEIENERFPTRKNIAHFEAQEDPVKLPITKGKDISIRLFRGDIVVARITQDLLGYEGSLSPVRAIVTGGPFKGGYFVGNATMDPKTKDVVVKFDYLRTAENDQEYKIEAYVHSTSGRVGIVGEFESHYWRYFFADLLAGAVGGYAEASKQREQGLYGINQPAVTPDNAVKGAVAGAAQATANLMAEKAKSAPEYTLAKGPHDIQLFIVKGPNDF